MAACHVPSSFSVIGYRCELSHCEHSLSCCAVQHCLLNVEHLSSYVCECVCTCMLCIFIYIKEQNRRCVRVCVCVCAAAIITKVATRCTLSILKSLISVQQSALLVAPPLHTHTNTHTPTLQPDNFAAYFPMLGRKLFAGKIAVRLHPRPPLQVSSTKPPVTRRPLCLLIAHILRSIYA